MAGLIRRSSRSTSSPFMYGIVRSSKHECDLIGELLKHRDRLSSIPRLDDAVAIPL